MASSSPTPARSEGLGGGLPAHAAPGSCSHTALVGGLPRGGPSCPLVLAHCCPGAAAAPARCPRGEDGARRRLCHRLP